MKRKIVITEEQFAKTYKSLAKMNIQVYGMKIVKHMVGSTILDTIGGYSSPSDYWKHNFKDTITPSDLICTSCMKIKHEGDFVVGHVTLLNGENRLYPVCDRCNKKYKNSKASHLFYADSSKLKPLPKNNLSD